MEWKRGVGRGWDQNNEGTRGKRETRTERTEEKKAEEVKNGGRRERTGEGDHDDMESKRVP